MASPKSPAPPQTTLPIVNSDQDSPVLVHELTGSTVIGDNLHMVFSAIRPTFSVDASGQTTVTLGRDQQIELVMPLAGISDMQSQLRQILDGRALHQMMTPGQSGSSSIN